MTHFVGIDFGTSGARLIVIDAQQEIRFQHAIAFQSQSAATDPQAWRNTLFALLEAIPTSLKSSVERIAIDGTSSTILLCDAAGHPLTEPKMYCDRGNLTVLDLLETIAPPGHIVLSLSSSLCKYLSWQGESYFAEACQLLHQADWLAAQLHGQWGVSDYHNSLKLGFDPVQLAYPEWFDAILDCSRLPQPLPPGQPVGVIQPSVSERTGLPKQVQICAGTTDSIAAFLASEAARVGDAVTSLGSTLVLKLLSQTRVDSSDYGVYSHWFGCNWLVGGASNAGGAVLTQFFSPESLTRLSQEINWSRQVQPCYTPLPKPGERFPINDPTLEPCFDPKPLEQAEFLQMILASLTRIEKEGYQKLEHLGAASLRRLWTAGGGTCNRGWMNWRQTQFNVPVLLSRQPEAAYGAARLAMGYLKTLQSQSDGNLPC